MTIGFYIGRFQPFHNGHMSVIKKALEEVDKLIIGIGSAEKCYTKDNPFTTGERIDMITAALQEVNPNKYLIIPVRDIDRYGMWVSHVEMLCPKFDTVYTGSPITKMLFEKREGYEIKEVSKVFDFSATEIRMKMLNSEDWQGLLPDSVVEYLKKMDVEKRIKEVMAKD